MKFGKQFKVLIFFVVILTILLACAKPATTVMAEFLSKSDRVDANILVIEGWLSYNDLKAAADEFISGKYDYILTTGIKATTDYYNVNTDGYLIFHTANFLKEPIRTIGVKARSELDGENSAHFNLWVNDSLVADFTADKRKRQYSVNWDGTRVDSVMIQFDNDLVGDFGDRNLFVKELILNGNVIVPFLNNSVYDISALDNRNRIINNMKSNSELTAKRLLSMGIDSSKVIPIPGRKVRINRTLTSALALRDWLKESEIYIRGINIVSYGSHSRRTWMTFDKVLDKKVNVGIIALADKRYTGPDGVAYLKTLRETIAYLYYSIILLPY
jgi:hypothetical protein